MLLQTQDADLYAQMNHSMADVACIKPLTDTIEDVLRVFYSFQTPKVGAVSQSVTDIVVEWRQHVQHGPM